MEALLAIIIVCSTFSWLKKKLGDDLPLLLITIFFLVVEPWAACIIPTVLILCHITKLITKE